MHSLSDELLRELCGKTDIAARNAIHKVTEEWLDEEHRNKGVHIRVALAGITDFGTPWFYELFNKWLGGFANRTKKKYPLYVANSGEKAWRLLRNLDTDASAFETWDPNDTFSWPGAIAVATKLQIDGVPKPIDLLISCSGVPWEGDEAICVETALESDKLLGGILGINPEDLQEILVMSQNEVHPGITA